MVEADDAREGRDGLGLQDDPEEVQDDVGGQHVGCDHAVKEPEDPCKGREAQEGQDVKVGFVMEQRGGREYPRGLL